MTTTPDLTTTNRRSKGTGTKRADGIWRVRAKVAGKCADFYGPSFMAAQANAHTAAKGGTVHQRGSPTVAEWLAAWIEDRTSSLKPQTWTRYGRRLPTRLRTRHA
jgi:hypothetical protein